MDDGVRVVVVRADASPQLGGGHVIRCAALAYALKSAGAQVVLAARPGALAVAPFIADAYDRVIDLPEDPSAEAPCLRAALPQGCAGLILDHYGRGAAFTAACRPWARRILVIDDLADRRHDGDVLVDPSAGRDPAEYLPLTSPGTTILTGPNYAPLRPEFAALRPAALARRAAGGGRIARVQISFGATDPDGASLTAVKGLALLDRPLAVEVALGPTAPCLAEIAALADEGCGALSIELVVAARDMARRIAGCDLAIGAGGASAWERCCLGAPSLVAQTADNQRAIVAGMAAAGAARAMGWARDLTPEDFAAAVAALLAAPERVTAMSAAAAGLCDGAGAARLAVALYGCGTIRAKI